MVSGSPKARVGVIGTGVIATSVHIPVIQNIDTAELSWVSDADFSLARKVASINRTKAVSTTEIRSALADCDVVLLAIPLMPRAQYFDLLCEKPVAVLSEKPLALHAADHRKYADRIGDARLSICYARRFHGSSRLLRSIMDAEVLGLPKVIRVAEGGRAARTGGVGTYQDESVEKGGGITLNLACHALDCVFWITRANSYVIRKCEVEWDGDTDRRLRAEILLQGLGGRSGQETVLDILVTNLDAVPNTMEFEFEKLTLRCPIPASDRCDVLVNGALTDLTMCSSQGARNSLESYHQLWTNVLSSHHQKKASDVSARSSVLMAELMDELLRR